jgi:hypothetical protein
MTSEPKKESKTHLVTILVRRFVARGKAYGIFQPGEMVEATVTADNVTVTEQRLPCVHPLRTLSYLFPQGSESAESLAQALNKLGENDGGGDPPTFKRMDDDERAIPHSHEAGLAEDNTVTPPQPAVTEPPSPRPDPPRGRWRPGSKGG